MNFDNTILLTEVLLAIAIIQQSLEHLQAPLNEKKLFLPRIILSILLLLGISPAFVCILLFINTIMILIRFRGPYNGGSDRMIFLVLFSLCLVHLLPNFQFKEYVFAYLALQVILSYFLSGFFKVINPEWWSARVLKEVLETSCFPASETIRNFAKYSILLIVASWFVILFELLFPCVLLSKELLVIGLCSALVFHLVNTYLFGFNRFFWAWLAAYPALIWFQSYLMLK
jgi:hypothetical protein